MAVALRDRLRLLALLREGGAGPLLLLVAVTLVVGAVPAATAWSLANLVDQVAERFATAGGAGALLSSVAAPLAAFGAVILLGQLAESVREPLQFLVQSRADGAFRVAVSRTASTSPTIGMLETPQVQRLAVAARADPEMWIERTPGAGGVAMLMTVGRGFALVTASIVLARFAWWLVPLVIVPAIAFQQLHRHDGLRYYREWDRNSGPGLLRSLWTAANYEPDKAKEVRVFGLGDFAVERAVEHTRAMYVPVWQIGIALVIGQWRLFLLVFVPLAIGSVLVARSAAAGHTSLVVATAALAAGASIYRVFGGDPRDVVGALVTLRAADQLQARLVAHDAQGDPGHAAAGPAGPRGIATDAPVPDAPVPDVRFEGVRFGYPGGPRDVLSGLNLQIRPGELLAIVGLNGAGKSTLIKLLAGLYTPVAGRITADGTDIEVLGPDRWRQRLSVVFQDFVRYHLTLADNVALGNATVPVDRAALEAAGRDAGLADLVTRLPNGWETPLARDRSGGVDLSGGQWQQVVLARALYAVRTGARVLVLDEPTAHLDVRTEFEVFERLAAHRASASVVLISHRLSTVRSADRIVLLDGGRITESGTHDELMALDGTYAEMFRIQAERFQRGFEDRIEEGELL